jgi:hypothetical protein
MALTFWLALHMSSLKAQLLGPYGNSYQGTFEVDANGLLSDTGLLYGGTLSLGEPGPRMIWYPGKAAFRAGNEQANEWDDSNIGLYSVAFGTGSTASGGGSAAFGSDSMASGASSVATGYFSVASGEGSTAMGGRTTAIGEFSTAMGFGGTASGSESTAMGVSSTASGSVSTAMGESSSATGSYSTAMGYYTTASSYDSLAIGFFNNGGGNSSTWIPTDPLFEIGNGGTSSGYYSGNLHLGNPAFNGPSDAFVVYKNGNAQVQGTIRCSPGGDISMGSFTAGTAP